MQNLDQLRAVHALQAATDPAFSRKDVTKLPALIIGNGLLATVAFCQDGTTRKGMRAALGAVAGHLRQRGLLTGGGNPPGSRDILTLAQRDSHDLQRATEEALAYLAYLKRFAANTD